MSQFTVIGGRGFIGTEIVTQLESALHSVWVPERDDSSVYSRNLGTVLYCAGNGDCKNAPYSVLESNVTYLSRILKDCSFDRLVYISSTRVYMNNLSSSEDGDISIFLGDNRRLFNITKLLGEEICLLSGRPVTIVRPSNVYGLALSSPLFLPSITRNAINSGKVDMFIAPDYSKDYISVQDVAYAVIKLSQSGNSVGEIYNVASGMNVKASEIANLLVRYTGCEVIWHSTEVSIERFPVTDIGKLQLAINDFKPRNVLEDLESMIVDFRKSMN
ncbi:NAD-dependent epimerase/dehydratase family protein [Shewanella sp.]|uniref:NAD-dependent epimerase/dehydratase family protein n=1 Tax=Shewanella sp. TaxID=50422 RepID=UPI003A985AE8